MKHLPFSMSFKVFHCDCHCAIKKLGVAILNNGKFVTITVTVIVTITVKLISFASLSSTHLNYLHLGVHPLSLHSTLSICSYTSKDLDHLVYLPKIIRI